MASAVSGVDLDLYCARIGYRGPREPTLRVLRDLQVRHAAAIAFEGVDVLLGRGISLDAAAVDAKLLASGRGGYCFEQNSLFRRVLTALGFRVAPLIARSRWGRPLDEPRARTHMALRVRLEEEDWLADVGSPRAMLTAPLRMGASLPQETPFEMMRVIPMDDELRVEALTAEGWRPIYDLVVQPQLDVDLAAANWFASTHPSSPFRQTLIACRATPESRQALFDNRLTVHRPGCDAERSRLSSDDLERCLAETFGLSVAPEWRPIIEAAVARGDGRSPD